MTKMDFLRNAIWNLERKNQSLRIGAWWMQIALHADEGRKI